MSPSLIRLSEVQRRTGYSKAWIYRLMGQGKFPSSVKIGSRSIAFVESEVDDWINQRIEESRKEVAENNNVTFVSKNGSWPNQYDSMYGAGRLIHVGNKMWTIT